MLIVEDVVWIVSGAFHTTNLTVELFHRSAFSDFMFYRRGVNLTTEFWGPFKKYGFWYILEDPENTMKTFISYYGDVDPDGSFPTALLLACSRDIDSDTGTIYFATIF